MLINVFILIFVMTNKTKSLVEFSPLTKSRTNFELPKNTNYDAILGINDSKIITSLNSCEIIIRNGDGNIYSRALEHAKTLGYQIHEDSSHNMGLEDLREQHAYVFKGKSVIGSISKFYSPIDIEHVLVSSIHDPVLLNPCNYVEKKHK